MILHFILLSHNENNYSIPSILLLFLPSLSLVTYPSLFYVPLAVLSTSHTVSSYSQQPISSSPWLPLLKTLVQSSRRIFPTGDQSIITGQADNIDAPERCETAVFHEPKFTE
jgi:hypothetical protein